MTIGRTTPSGTVTETSAGTAVSCNCGTLVLGQLVNISLASVSNSVPTITAGTLTQTAGAGAISSPTLDVSVGGDNGDGTQTFSTQWSFICTTAGPVTVTAAGFPGSSFLSITPRGLATTGTWDAARVEATNGAHTATNGATALSSGNATSAGEACFVTALALNNGAAVTVTTPSGFVAVADNGANGATAEVLAVADDLVTVGTTQAGAWTFTALDGAAYNGQTASLVVYREAAPAGPTTTTSGRAGARAANATAVGAAPKGVGSLFLAGDARALHQSFLAGRNVVGGNGPNTTTSARAGARGATVTSPGVAAPTTVTTARLGARAQDATTKAVALATSARAGVRGADSTAKATSQATQARAGARGVNAASKAAATATQARAGSRVQAATAKASTTATSARAGARADVSTVAALGLTTSTVARAGLRAAAAALKAAATATAARAGARADDATTKAAVSATSARAGARGQVATVQIVGQSTSTAARAGLRAAAFAAKAAAAATEGRAGLRAAAATAKAATTSTAARAGARAEVATAVVGPRTTSTAGRAGLRSLAVTVKAASTSTTARAGLRAQVGPSAVLPTWPAGGPVRVGEDLAGGMRIGDSTALGGKGRIGGTPLKQTTRRIG